LLRAGGRLAQAVCAASKRRSLCSKQFMSFSRVPLNDRSHLAAVVVAIDQCCKGGQEEAVPDIPGHMFSSAIEVMAWRLSARRLRRAIETPRCAFRLPWKCVPRWVIERLLQLFMFAIETKGKWKAQKRWQSQARDF